MSTTKPIPMQMSPAVGEHRRLGGKGPAGNKIQHQRTRFVVVFISPRRPVFPPGGPKDRVERNHDLRARRGVVDAESIRKTTFCTCADQTRLRFAFVRETCGVCTISAYKLYLSDFLVFADFRPCRCRLVAAFECSARVTADRTPRTKDAGRPHTPPAE